MASDRTSHLETNHQPSEHYMRMAIRRAREGVEHGQTPFGAVIVRNGAVIACEHNVVGATTDITAHAEIHAIRTACQRLRTLDLSGCDMYSTCEPCPMCFSACHWARIDRIVFGADIADARRFGFNELTISNAALKQFGGSTIEVVPGFLSDECLEVFRTFAERPDRLLY